ncbi:MAG: hypothetical protein C4331_16740 [Meiothermus sp.]
MRAGIAPGSSESPRDCTCTTCAYTPELSPAEVGVPLLREALANRSFASLRELEETVEKRCAYAVLSVTDNGPGMSPEVLRRAAEPFYRAPGNRTPGSGLGLSVVARVAEVHGGRLELKTNLPHGLRAEVWLAR